MSERRRNRRSEQQSPAPPAPPAPPVEAEQRVINGQHLRFLDGAWTEDGVPVAAPRFVVLKIEKVIQRWKDGLVIEVHREPLPDLQRLNASVPEREWEIDLNNQKRPPFQQCYLVYMIDPTTAARYTFPGSSIGAGIAVRALRESIEGMQILRGRNFAPVVELSSRPMKTRFSSTPRPRPHFVITGWQALGGGNNTPQITDGGGNGTPPASDPSDPIPF
jgi:hypothetical protein